MAGLSHNLTIYLVFSALLFALGVMTTLSRKNAIGLFMGIELILNAAALNFVAFQTLQKHADTTLNGHMFSLFIIIIAAIEAAVALAIVLRVFALRSNVDPDKAVELRG